MKLLIVTQKVDQDEQLLGFFIRWIQELAKRFAHITILCLQKGNCDLPNNVNVYDLGKDRGYGKARQAYEFYKRIIEERKNYDAVFVHMNPVWVILGGLWWRLNKKLITLWYAHGHVSSKLKLAERLSNVIFTSTKEGFRLSSRKVKIVGQGIDVELFAPGERVASDIFRIISVGRIAPSKDYETLVNAMGVLKETQKFRVDIWGGPGKPEDLDYMMRIEELVHAKGMEENIKFHGPISNVKIVGELRSSDLFVNMGRTGSLDKAVLEAMATGQIVLTSNEAFKSILENLKDELMFSPGEYRELAEKIQEIKSWNEDRRSRVSQELRSIVIRSHRLEDLIQRISDTILTTNV